MKKLKFLGLVLLSALVLFMTACGEDAVQIGSEPTFIAQQTQPSTAPAVSTPVATTPSEPTQPTEPVHIHAWCEATCTSAKTCIDCGETEGDALGHNWQAATCTAPKTCTACGETEGDALGHNWQAATCAAPETCTVCGETAGEMLAHSWDAGTVSKEATESAEGEMLYTCTACGETMTQSIPALDHQHSYTSVVTKPTCTKKGYTTYTCRCGDSYKSNTTAALQHQVNDWDVVLAPTCTDVGEEGGTCQRCDTYLTRPLDAISGMNETYYAVVIAESVNVYDSFDSSKVVGTLYKGERLLIYEQKEDDVVWARISEGKPYISIGWNGGGDLFAERPCDGWIRLNKKVEVEVVRTPYGHIWGDWYVSQRYTCGQTGEVTRKCTVCDAAQVQDATSDEFEILGHQWGEWMYTKAATCTADGEKLRVCAYCAAEDTAVIAGRHYYFVTQDTTSCARDGKITETCSVCNDKIVTEVSAPGHHFHEFWNREPSMDHDDVWVHRVYKQCTTCLYDETVWVELPAGHEHKWEFTYETELTCTTVNIKYYACECGAKRRLPFGSVMGHKWSEFDVIFEPTQECVGMRVRACTKCEEKQYIATPKLDENGAPPESFIDPRFEKDDSLDYYTYKSIAVYDQRDWASPIILQINEDDSVTLIYFNQNGMQYSIKLRQVRPSDLGSSRWGHEPVREFVLRYDDVHLHRITDNFFSDRCPACKKITWNNAEEGEIGCIRSFLDDTCPNCGGAIKANECHHCMKGKGNGQLCIDYAPLQPVALVSTRKKDAFYRQTYMK